MANHPSRNWRRVAHEAANAHAQQWRNGQDADPEAPLQFLPPDECQRIEGDVRQAYLDGYVAGRASTRPRPA